MGHLNFAFLYMDHDKVLKLLNQFGIGLNSSRYLLDGKEIFLKELDGKFSNLKSRLLY